MTVAALPADNGHIVVTIATFKDDPILSGELGDEMVFQQICNSVPNVAALIDPSVARPTGPVFGWANMDFMWRSTIAESGPQVLGFFFVGDTALRSNPKYGRGCTCGALGARTLAEVLARHSDPTERLVEYEGAQRRQFREEWEDLLVIDRADYRRFSQAVGLRPLSKFKKLRSKAQLFLLNRAIIASPEVFRAYARSAYGAARPSAWVKALTWRRLLGAVVVKQAVADAAKAAATGPTRGELAAWIATAKQQ